MRVWIAVALAIASTWYLPGVARADDPVIGLPSLSTTDGKFIGLPGQGLQTLTQATKVWIGVRGNQTAFGLDIFDADLGGLWDNHDPLNPVQAQFLLYADPTKSGNPTGKTLVASANSAAPAAKDNDWLTLYSGPVHAGARSASGHYFYLLIVQWSNPAIAANEFNAFKVRARAQVSLTPGDWAFVGAPINLGVDPAFGTARNTYDGHWEFFAFVPFSERLVSITECDADARDHAIAGSPPDDDPNDARVRIPPSVRYSVFRPDRQLLLANLVPSGNTVCDTRTAGISSGGLFRWVWSGVDAHNLVFIRSLYETLSVEEAPLSPSAPTPTPTATRTPVPPTATAVSTATPTQAPPPAAAPAPPTATPQPPVSTPIPIPTATDTPIPIPTATYTPGPESDAGGPVRVALVQAPPKADVAVRALPKAGGETVPVAVAIAVGAFLVVVGTYLRLAARTMMAVVAPTVVMSGAPTPHAPTMPEKAPEAESVGRRPSARSRRASRSVWLTFGLGSGILLTAAVFGLAVGRRRRRR